MLLLFNVSFAANIDIEAMERLEKLIKKIEEMKNQRATFWNELRTAVHNDDITGVLVTKEANQSLDDLFQKELDKHKKLVSFCKQLHSCNSTYDSFDR